MLQGWGWIFMKAVAIEVGYFSEEMSVVGDQI